MSEDNIKKTLRTLGLTDKESEVYILLSRTDALKGSEVSKQLRMHKAQVYNILKILQKKGMAEMALESPARFTAAPFENILNSFIRQKKDEAAIVEKEKDALLTSWEHIRFAKPASSLERFITILGRKSIENKMLTMINEAKMEIKAITTGIDIIRADQTQLIETIMNKLKKNRSIKCEILTNISKENLNIVKNTLKIDEALPTIQWRQLSIKSESIPRIVIKDDEETFIQYAEIEAMQTRNISGLWTNSKLITNANNSLFENLWKSGIDAKEKILEIEATSPLERTTIIRDGQEAYSLFIDIINKAENEITEISPSIDILKHQGVSNIQKLQEKNVKIRIMCSIDSSNIQQIKSLSKHCDIRDPSVSYLKMALVDGRHLFRFNSGFDDSDPAICFKDMLYTNEPREIKTMAEMFDGLWRRSVEIKDIEPKIRKKK